MNSDYVVAFPSRDAYGKGLSKDFYKNYQEFREIYERASDLVGEDLYKYSYIDTTRPELHMVCLLTHCYGIYKVLTKKYSLPFAAIGFSQGEFTAATAAGAIDLPQVLILITKLEQLIIQESQKMNGVMSRIVYLQRDKLEELFNKVDPSNKNVRIGIYLSEDQNIISGERVYVEKVCQLAKDNGARWVIPLEGNIAFHSNLCMDIQNKSNRLFNQCNFINSEYEVYSCFDGKSTTKGDKIRQRLSKQIAHPVLWDKIILDLKRKGIKKIIELGGGCTISGNSRIVCPDNQYIWINNIKDMKRMEL